MRTNSVLIVLLSLSMLYFSFWLLPKEHEIALIYYKNKNYEKAFNLYRTLHAGGDNTIKVLVPLAELSLIFGDVSRAVHYMEQLIEHRPEDVRSRNLLGKMYQFAQRPEEYIKNLEYINHLAPTEKGLSELADYYHYQQQYEKQINTLQWLIDLYPNDPDYFIDLIYIQSSLKKFDDVINTMDRFMVHYPSFEKNHKEVILLSIRLYLSKGYNEKATEIASKWLKNYPSINSAVEIGDIFNQNQYYADAKVILQPFVKKYNDSLAFNQVYYQIRSYTGELELVYQELQDEMKKKRLPAALNDDYLDFCFRLKKRYEAISFSLKIDKSTLPDWLLSSLMDIAIEYERVDFAHSLSHQLQEYHFYRQPILAAQMHFMLSQFQRSQYWLNTLFSREFVSVNDKLKAIFLYQRMGSDSQALRIAHNILEQDFIDNQSIYELTYQSYYYGYLNTIADKISTKLSTDDDLAAHKIRTILLSDDDKTNELIIAINKLHVAQEIDFLRTLFSVSTRDKKYESAALLARVIYENSQSDEDKLLHLLSELKRHHYDYAFNGLSELVEKGVYRYQDYEFELAQASVHSEKQRNRYVTFKLEELQRQMGNKNVKKSISIIYQLHNNNVLDDAIPYVQQLASSGHEEMHYLYQEHLIEQSHFDRLVQYWKILPHNPRIDDQLKYQTTFLMLEHNSKSLAVDTLLSIANGKNYNHPYVMQLLYLWGPKLSVQQIQWLENQAIQSENKEKLGWWRLLAKYNQAVPPLNTLITHSLSDQDVEHIVMIVKSIKDKPKAINMLDQVSQSDSLAHSHYEKLAITAIDINALDLSIKLYEKLLNLYPEQLKYLKSIAHLLFEQRQYDQAYAYFERYHRATKGDYHSHFIFAELMLLRGWDEKAKMHFHNAINMLQHIEHKDLEQQYVYTQSHIRLGYQQKAKQLFQSLVSDYPEHQFLKLSYAAMLIEAGDSYTPYYLLYE